MIFGDKFFIITNESKIKVLKKLEMKEYLNCPNCGASVEKFRNPIPTVDVIIEIKEGDVFKGIVLIFRKNEPKKWAIPGGFIDYGESAEDAALREAKEETGLSVFNLRQFYVYSKAGRDPRMHTISVVFTAEAKGIPKPADDAKEVGIFTEYNLPVDMAFDHQDILRDYFGRMTV